MIRFGVITALVVFLIAGNANGCAPGYYYVPEVGSEASQCLPCPIGTFQPNTNNATSCIDCYVGHYQDLESEVECKKCPTGSTTNVVQASQLSQCECSSGYYLTNDVCASCPVGGYCAGKSVLPVALPGYWVSPDDPTVFYSCIPDEACIGGPSSPCADRYEGRMCGSCTDSHYSVEGRCLECPGNAKIQSAFFVLIYLIVGLICFKAAGSPTLGSLFIMINFFQALSVYPRLVADFDSSIKTMLNAFSMANLNPEFFAFECYAGFNFSERWMVTVALPPLYFLLYTLSYWIHCLFVRDSLDRLALKWQYRQSFFVVLSLLYTLLVLTTTEFFDCTKQPDDTYSLDAAPSVECYSSEWNDLLPMSLIPMVFYVIGIPAYNFGNLISHRSIFHEDKFSSKYGWLYMRFHPSLWYWEIVLLIRRAVTVGFLVMFSKYVIGQVIPLFVTFFTLILTLRWRPYRNYASDTLESFILMLQFICQFCLFIYQYRETDVYEHDSSDYLTIATMISIGFAIILSIYYLFKEWRQMKREENEGVYLHSGSAKDLQPFAHSEDDDYYDAPPQSRSSDEEDDRRSGSDDEGPRKRSPPRQSSGRLSPALEEENEGSPANSV